MQTVLDKGELQSVHALEGGVSISQHNTFVMACIRNNTYQE